MNAKPKLARKKLAEGTASLVLRELDLHGLHVDPEAVANDKGILVQAKPDTAEGVSGMLLKVGDEFGIMYATNIRSRGFQRFIQQPQNIRVGARDAAECHLNDWMDGDRVHRVVEEVVGLGQYGRTLTILTCPSLSEEPGEEDEQEDEDLLDRWTPKFRC